MSAPVDTLVEAVAAARLRDAESHWLRSCAERLRATGAGPAARAASRSTARSTARPAPAGTPVNPRHTAPEEER